MSTVARAVGSALSNLAKQVEADSRSIAGGFQVAGKALMATGLGMMTAGAALAGGMYKAALAAANFDSQIILLHTHAGLATSALAGVSNYVLNLAGQVGFNPTSLANAFYLVQSATTSLPPKLQSVAAKEDILAQSARLAAIGHANLSDTVNAVVDVLDVYGKANYTASEAAGILNTTVGEGKMRLQDLAQAFSGGLLPVAEQAGIKLQSLGAAIATLTDVGIPASRAATYLRSAIIQISEPSAAANASLNALGIGSAAAATQMQGFSQVLAAAGVNQTMVAGELRSTGSLGQTMTWLSQKLTAAGLNAQQAGSLMNKAFGGIRSGTGVASLYNNLNSLVAKEKDATKGGQSFAQTWAYFNSQDPEQQIHKLDASLSSVEISLGQAFLPILMQLVGAITPLVQRISSWVQAHEQLVGAVAKGLLIFLLVGGAITTMAGAFSYAAGVILALLGAFGPLSFLIKPLPQLFAGLGGVLKWVASGFEYLGAFGLSALSLLPEAAATAGIAIVSAIGPVILVIAALAAAAFIVGVAFHDHFGQIEKVVGGAMKMAQTAIGTFVSVLQKTHSPAEAFGAALKSIGIGGKGASEAMTIIQRGIKLVETAFNSGVAQARHFWAVLGQGLSKIHGAGQALTYLVDGLKLLGIGLGIVAAILAVLIGGVFKALITGLGVAIPVAIQVAIDAINVIGSIIKLLADWITGLAKIADDVWNHKWGAALHDATALVRTMASDVGSIIANLSMLIIDLITGLARIVITIIVGFVTGVIGAAENLYNTLVGHSIFPDMVNAIIAWFEKLPGRVVGILTGMVGQVAGAAQRIGEAIFNGITGALSNLGGAIAGKVQSALGGIGGSVGALASKLGIPGLAVGGIVNKPTLALVGEAGEEAVIPMSILEGNKGGIGALPQSITNPGGAGGGGGSSIEQFATLLASALRGGSSGSGGSAPDPQLQQIIAALLKGAGSLEQILAQLILLNADQPTVAAMAARLGQ